MSKRKRSEDLSLTSPSSLLQLSSAAFARTLWRQKLKLSRLPNESSHIDRPFLENCKLQILEFLKENFPLMSDLCKVTISQEVNSAMNKMIDEFSHMSLSQQMQHVLKTSKWRDFTLSIWSCLKDKIRLVRFYRMFTRFVTRIIIIGLDALPNYELSIYLEIWTDAPKHYKLSVIDQLSQTWDYSRLMPRYEDPNKIRLRKKPPRDVRILQKLFADFDLAERIEIWRKNWISLIVDVRLNDLDPLMRMFCENQGEFEQFKAEWLSRDETIKDYYCRLLLHRNLDRLEEFLNFYSNDESKTLELAKSILRAYFGIDLTWDGSRNINHSRSGYNSVQRRIAQSGGWLGRAIKMPEFEYLFKKNVTKMRLHWYSLMHSIYLPVPFDEMHNFLKFFLPEEEVVFYEREFIKLFFLQNNPVVKYMCGNMDFSCRFNFIMNLDAFEALVNRIFPTTQEAENFKKEVIFSKITMDVLLLNWDGPSNPNHIRNFLAWCLPCKQDSNKWREQFARVILRTLRQHKRVCAYQLPKMFNLHARTGCDILSWCLDSEQLANAFKKSTTIDEIFLILTHNCSDPRTDRDFLFDAMNKILQWWYPSKEDIVDFKLNKLCEFSNDECKIEVLLGNPDGNRDMRMRAYYECTTDEERRAQIFRATFVSWYDQFLAAKRNQS